MLSTVPCVAMAVDLDDDVSPDTQERIGYDSANDQSVSEDEAKYPAEAKEVRAAIERHLSHVDAKDLNGYMSDFLKERMRYEALEREYAARALSLKDLKVVVKAVEFQKLSRTAATVHTRQITSYVDETGHPTVDDAIISYRWIKDANDGIWKIAFTERRRLTAE